MTAVSLLSSDTVFMQPFREEEKRKAGQAHRRFASREGDLLTLINIYEAWNKVHHDTVQYSAMPYITKWCNTMQSDTIQHYIIFYNIIHSIMVRYRAMQ